MQTGELLYKGKAKSIYRTDKDDELLAVFRDDITAFNGEKKDEFAGKGEYNFAASAFFFDFLEKNGVKTHYLRAVDERSMIVSKLNMIPLEVIARNRAAGSVVKMFPFEEGQILDPPVVVTDYKDDERGDPSINDDLIVALGLLTPEELADVREKTLTINRLLSDFFEGLGLILVDFKIEFGRKDGMILLGDEISMDSMRLWDMSTMESFDKDVYRFDKGDLMSAYARVVEKINQWKDSHME
ncbi:phosphoribosylaminoimidazolesuccinocarboxamide synthase [Methanoplanus endosymbiosus]|uniref:Phosphoribosylaminoimidazole-succinocarboxamide synthase n=1 Tax=Methanoplanus endosymbiosus TaxID=33865 RepID=A0A9E7PRJ7_9EURY|nr:phosphoribosylaminoimidazolesuccinocarboxamide synthase [Methanoplanus endosymbiosus]UUX93849.1 phosphoribosylaminoimidazolesuccinocarboxamide synthase [Methanoplanus endosymbiosus]